MKATFGFKQKRFCCLWELAWPLRWWSMYHAC